MSLIHDMLRKHEKCSCGGPLSHSLSKSSLQIEIGVEVDDSRDKDPKLHEKSGVTSSIKLSFR